MRNVLPKLTFDPLLARRAKQKWKFSHMSATNWYFKEILLSTVPQRKSSQKKEIIMIIAIDAMGGDHAPHMNVDGAIRAALEWIDTEIVLVGDSAQIEPLLINAPANVRIHHAAESILASDEPVKAVRRKKDASMVVAA